MIDINKPESFKTLKIEDLVKDAVERKDLEALEWLQVESQKKDVRTREDKTTYEVAQSIVKIRAAYVKKFLGYKSQGSIAKEKARQAKKEKREQELKKMFDAAFAEIKK
ncbi:MAG: hypothetical protein J6C08_08270 [Campylobacter sp.]|uniref:hypothetical protein n=1 Tax=Campylobacter sp. TaxID=205 RepID=UPI001B06B9FE|nr:hypothetical protein [Campylobacter sp.]MBO5064485.1 hypothetical protein [Campylobacter sp.]